jgi:hypothetical protein
MGRGNICVAIGLVMVLGAGSTEAQFATRYAGITAGATSSDLTNYATSLDSRWGFTAGLTAGVVTFDYSFVELAPAWTQMGAEGIRLDYVDIPLLIGGLTSVADDAVLLRLYGGVALGLKVGCESTLAAVCDATKGSVWALPLGASVAMAVGGGRFIGLDARYHLGLSDVFEQSDVSSRSWQFRALFAIPVGRF